jgi:hypothetical protein
VTTAAIWDTVLSTESTRGIRMSEAGVIDEGFFRRYRELLDAEDAAFDELEHAYEEGDRVHYEQDLEQWRALVERRTAFLGRHGMFPVPAT